MEFIVVLAVAFVFGIPAIAIVALVRTSNIARRIEET